MLTNRATDAEIINAARAEGLDRYQIAAVYLHSYRAGEPDTALVHFHDGCRVKRFCRGLNYARGLT